ncbi:primase-helicase family protein, partial [Endozoicomonas sp.]|uniref:primase-helicase family protein n=1 Tax=Endozoicomonas sp. TaxID=1892382 RepID=UPI00383A8E08
GYQFQRPVVVQKAKQQSTSMIPVKVDQTTLAEKGDQKKNNQMESPPALTVVPDCEPVPINDQVALSNAIREGIDALVGRYNKVFVHSRISTSNLIMKLELDDEYQQYAWKYMTFKDFREMLIHEQPIPISEEEDNKGKKKVKFAPPAQVWLTSQNANFVPCSTFYPKLSEDWPPMHDGKLNFYRGFAVEPMLCTKADPDVKRWLYHMRTVVCRDDDVAYQYLMNWFAHLIQKPWEKPQTAIILKGGQGTGKNVALKPLLRILGVHGLYIEKPGAVSGKHNKIMENRTLVFADEAAFHSEKDCGILRALISETSSSIEPKGIDAYNQRNFIRVIMATNSDHAIRFATDERRYVVLELSTCHKQDLEYFGKLVAAIDNGLADKLLYLFQQRDISQFLPMDIPQTGYLTEGKINNLEPQQAFVYEALMYGSFILNGGWASNTETSAVRTWFQEWLDKKRIKFHGDIGRKLGKVISKIGGTRKRTRTGNALSWEYYFKDLENSRNLFEENVLSGSVITWESKEA